MSLEEVNGLANGAPLARHGSRPFTVAIDPIALVITECITVTSAMRKHARWAHSSVAAILGGASRQSTPDLKPDHDRKSSSGSTTIGDDDGLLTGRWGLRGKRGSSMQDNPLLAAFARLRSDLKSCKGTIQGRWSGLTLILSYDRHTEVQYTCSPAALHAGHSIVLDNRSHHLSRPHCDYEDAGVQRCGC